MPKLAPRRFLPITLLLATAGSAAAQWSHHVVADSLSLNVRSQLRTADIDGDGDLDILRGGSTGDRLVWFENEEGSGLWTEHFAVNVTPPLSAVVLGDIDGDGDADLVVGDASRSEWIENDGAGNFTTAHTIPRYFMGSTGIGGGDLGDIDGDGDLDLLCGTLQGGWDTTVIYINNGGTLQRGSALYSHGRGASLRDVDGDGDLDVTIGGGPWYSLEPRLFLNDGLGGMTAEFPYSLSPFAEYAQFVDLDGDGDIDFLDIRGIEGVMYRERLTSSSYAPEVSLVTGRILDSRMADMDGDGLADLVVLRQPGGTGNPNARIEWYRIAGDGQLGPPILVRPDPSHMGSHGLAIGDMDRDGDLDLVGLEGGFNFGTIHRLFVHRNDRTIETQWCAGEPNTTGERGRLAVSGSAVAELNSCGLLASELPTGQFGLFLVSATPTAPQPLAGSAGMLCVGGSIGRFNGSIGQIGPDGTASFLLDLTAIPTSTGLESIMAGDTRYFAYWHRDLGTSNLTETVSVSFQ